MGIFRQPLEALAVFAHTRLEITLKFVRRESVSAAQDFSPCSIRTREPGDRLWIFGIVRVAREIWRDINLELAVQETNCCSRSAVPGGAIAARIGNRFFGY